MIELLGMTKEKDKGVVRIYSRACGVISLIRIWILGFILMLPFLLAFDVWLDLPMITVHKIFMLITAILVRALNQFLRCLIHP